MDVQLMFFSQMPFERGKPKEKPGARQRTLWLVNAPDTDRWQD
jgi:hypothetical protein